MERLFATNYSFQELFLLLRWYNLVLSIFGKSLVSSEVLAQNIYETTKREVSMLVQIKELLLENSVIMWILLADIQNVNNSFPPWSEKV